jgi:hypothetical protein
MVIVTTGLVASLTLFARSRTFVPTTFCVTGSTDGFDEIARKGPVPRVMNRSDGTPEYTSVEVGKTSRGRWKVLFGAPLPPPQALRARTPATAARPVSDLSQPAKRRFSVMMGFPMMLS